MKKSCLHYVGLRGQQYYNAVKVWGEPDYYHYCNDGRVKEEVDWENDVVVYGDKDRPQAIPYNDSAYQ